MIIKMVHVYLLEEAVHCWFGGRAEHLGADLYRLIDPSPEDPVLEFDKGDVVRCRAKLCSGDGSRPDWEGLVAYEKISN